MAVDGHGMDMMDMMDMGWTWDGHGMDMGWTWDSPQQLGTSGISEQPIATQIRSLEESNVLYCMDGRFYCLQRQSFDVLFNIIP